MKLPAQERADRLAILEVGGFVWGQRNISDRNKERLRELVESSNAELAELAAVVLQIAIVAPGRRRRLARIREAHPLLWARMLAVNLVPGPDDVDDEFLSEVGEEFEADDELGFDCDFTGDFAEDPRVRPKKRPPNVDDSEIPF